MGDASEQQLDCALDLLRRLPPKSQASNLAAILDLAPHLTEELLSAVDQPLASAMCSRTGRAFLVCDYNRDGDCYRSPWSNEYYPPATSTDDPVLPSPSLRKLEIAANDAFDTYRDLYFEGGLSSVYFWDLDSPNSFAAVVLIKKVNEETQAGWDSIHVFEVSTPPSKSARSAHYKLTSTVMLYMNGNQSGGGLDMNLSGSLTRQSEQDCPLDDHHHHPSSSSAAAHSPAHIANMGRLIEDMESKLRSAIQEIYFGKTKDIVNDLRSVQSLADVKKQGLVQAELAGKLGKRLE